jgi:hypothetical protein
MGRTYADLLVDGDLPRLLFQAYAACDDPGIRAVVRQESTTLREAVARWSGADDTTLRAWFAEGMLLNVDAAVGDLTPGHHRSEQVALADRRRIGHPASSRNRPSARGRAQTRAIAMAERPGRTEARPRGTESTGPDDDHSSGQVGGYS